MFVKHNSIRISGMFICFVDFQYWLGNYGTYSQIGHLTASREDAIKQRLYFTVVDKIITILNLKARERSYIIAMVTSRQ